MRNAIYEIKPEIKREFVIEYLNDRQRYEDLRIIHMEAFEAEEAADYEKAIKKYDELLSKSEYGFFKLVAEAGLYRSINQMNKNKT